MTTTPRRTDNTATEYTPTCYTNEINDLEEPVRRSASEDKTWELDELSKPTREGVQSNLLRQYLSMMSKESPAEMSGLLVNLIVIEVSLHHSHNEAAVRHPFSCSWPKLLVTDPCRMLLVCRTLICAVDYKHETYLPKARKVSAVRACSSARVVSGAVPPLSLLPTLRLCLRASTPPFQTPQLQRARNLWGRGSSTNTNAKKAQQQV